jgi:hypothetical protein
MTDGQWDWDNILAVGPAWIEKIDGGWRVSLAVHGNKIPTEEKPHFVMETKEDLWKVTGVSQGGEDK